MIYILENMDEFLLLFSWVSLRYFRALFPKVETSLGIVLICDFVTAVYPVRA